MSFELKKGAATAPSHSSHNNDTCPISQQEGVSRPLLTNSFEIGYRDINMYMCGVSHEL